MPMIWFGQMAACMPVNLAADTSWVQPATSTNHAAKPRLLCLKLPLVCPPPPPPMAQVSLGKPVCLLPFLLVLLFTTLATRAQPEACDSDKAEYDVCVVGCGGSGAFIATKLKKMGYSVLVLEKQDRCGGHCKTVKLPVPLPGGGGCSPALFMLSHMADKQAGHSITRTVSCCMRGAAVLMSRFLAT